LAAGTVFGLRRLLLRVVAWVVDREPPPRPSSRFDWAYDKRYEKKSTEEIQA